MHKHIHAVVFKPGWKIIFACLNCDKMVLNGEAQCARQIVAVSNCEGKIIANAKPRYPTVRTAIFARLTVIYVSKSHLVGAPDKRK